MDSFANRNFLDKEAAINPLNLFRGRGGAATETAARQGKFVTNPNHQIGAGNGGHVQFYNQDEIKKQLRKEVDEESNGLVGDMVRGTASALTPNSWGVRDKINDGLFTMKNFLTNTDTKAGSRLAGNDPNSWRGKLFSVKTGGKERGGIEIGRKVNEDGSTTPIIEGGGMDRRPSVIAPYRNAVAVGSPFLAAAYVGEKLYPNEEQTAELQTDTFEKKAENDSVQEANHGILEEDHILQMDKLASMQKIAMLEEELEKQAAQIDSLTEEKELLLKEANYEREEKEKVSNNLDKTRKTLIHKQAEHDEFRLRTLARERSKSAVKLAEDMLEVGIIKQASFDGQVDKLMDCDQETFNMYTSMVKEAKNDEEGLESLAFLVDYKGNGIDSTTASNQKGFSKRGQSIGEAARDLIKK